MFKSRAPIACMLSGIMVAMLTATTMAAAREFQSHRPIRPLPQPSERPLAQGPGYFVAPDGDDTAAGTQDKPWKSINASLPKLQSGDTLYLRAGSYYEQVYCAIVGTPDKPITLRSYPGEVAVIDGGMAEFQENPAAAWEPATDSPADGEYVSTRSYKNIRDVIGLFGDSNIGLQTYWYLMDLRATNEKWIANKDTMIEPIYVGPGIFYNKETGRIHARLAHTRLELADAPLELIQYQGETDPRKLPLVIAPFQSRPLFVDQAMHVRFEDLVFRGGGYKTVELLFGVDITFDRCTIYAGTYGIWAKNTGPLKMTHSSIRGMIPPWAFRDENCLYAYSGSIYPPFVNGTAEPELGGGKKAPAQVARHIARLPSHALLVTEGGYEFDTFYYPMNHDWEVAYCEFTDGHDGIYPSGRDIRFHHNWVDNMQDDSVYLSSPTPYVSDRIYFHDNLITTTTVALGAHARGGPGGDIYVYRNVIDLRLPVKFARPTPEKPQGTLLRGSIPFLMHGSNHLLHSERLHFYHNTVISDIKHAYGSFAAGFLGGLEPDTARRVFNNLFLYYGMEGRYPMPLLGTNQKADLEIDGNLHWQIDGGEPANPEFLKNLREHPLGKQGDVPRPRWIERESSADPKLQQISSDPRVIGDYRLQPGSAAIGAGVTLPEGYPDSQRSAGEQPDAGASALNAQPLRVGIDGRITAGMLQDPFDR